MRMIPCIAGCAGPMLRSISRVSSWWGGQSCPQPAFSRLDPLESGSATSGPLRLSTISLGHILVDRPNQGLALFDRIVLAQRVTLKPCVHEYALQVRMPPEADPEHVPYLA